MLDLSPDELLTTTRSVRKRLDLSRPVPRALIGECIEIALQAPNGSNRNKWRWLVVDDPALIREIGALYNKAQEDFLRVHGPTYQPTDLGRVAEMSESTAHLSQTLGRMPALLFPLMEGRPDGLDAMGQASHWGSILQAVWSFFLAARMRGLGSCWTTVHLMREKEMAALLGIPYAQYTQTGLFPVAYTQGTDFKKALRRPLHDVLSWNQFGQR